MKITSPRPSATHALNQLKEECGGVGMGCIGDVRVDAMSIYIAIPDVIGHGFYNIPSYPIRVPIDASVTRPTLPSLQGRVISLVRCTPKLFRRITHPVMEIIILE